MADTDAGSSYIALATGRPHVTSGATVLAPRAALVFTGFLRDTCHHGLGSPNMTTGVHALREQLMWCMQAFSGQCDVFIHTWITTQKAAPFRMHGAALNDSSLPGPNLTSVQANSSVHDIALSWKCVEVLQLALSATAVAIEAQAVPSHAQMASVRPWGAMRENLLNMRMQVASAIGGLQLMRRHATAMGVTYHAAVRMRADIGASTWQTSRKGWFLNAAGYRTMRRRADLYAKKQLPSTKSDELVLCGHPRYKHTDFCNWSVPPDPLVRTMEMLTGEAFDQVIYGGEGCEAYLTNNATDGVGRPMHIPAVSENVLYCAMRAGGVRPSSLVDTKAGVS